MFHIILHDDHVLFIDSMKFLLLKHYPDSIIKSFSNSEKALDYISHCLTYEVKYDLIITDYIHPPINGIYFSKYKKELESSHSLKTPIILHTMIQRSNEVIDAIKEGSIDAYIPKSASEHEVMALINLYLK